MPPMRFFLPMEAMFLTVHWLYFALMESSTWQGTLGKRALGMGVSDMHGKRISFGRASGRFFGKLVSGMTFLVGYVMAGFTETQAGAARHHRGLHRGEDAIAARAVSQLAKCAAICHARAKMTKRRLIHEVLPVGWLQCNCSILGDPETREALVLDPGDEVERVLDVLKRHSLNVKAIVSTHAHIDHVGGLQKLQQVTGAPVLMHGDDLELYQHLDEQAAWLGVPPPPSARVDQLLREGDTVRWGNYAAGVLHTPGHTPGSVSLYLPRDGLEPRE